MHRSARITPARLLLGGTGVGALAGVVVWLALVSADGSVRPWLVVALAVTGCVLAAMTVLLVERVSDDAGQVRTREPSKTHARTDRERGGLEGYERRIARAMEDVGRFNDVLRPQLRALAEGRLRSKLGVDSRTDPNRARALLGDNLWQLMTTPVQSIPTHQELDDWVRAIEAL